MENQEGHHRDQLYFPVENRVEPSRSRGQLGFPVENSAGPSSSRSWDHITGNFESSDDQEFYKWLPPGYRFKPTDQELIQEYLIKKIKNEPLPRNRMHNVKLYEHSPDQLADMFKLIKDREEEWFFFTPINKKYPNGSRPSRSTGASGTVDCESGYWKLSGKKEIIMNKKNEEIGIKSVLEFYSGKQPNGKLTLWKMHEYIASDSKPGSELKDGMLLDDCILVKLYINTRTGKKSASKTALVEDPNPLVSAPSPIQTQSLPQLHGPLTQQANYTGQSIQVQPQSLLGFGNDCQSSRNFHLNNNWPGKCPKLKHHEEAPSLQVQPPPLLGFDNNDWPSKIFHSDHWSGKFPSSSYLEVPSIQVQPPPLSGFGNNFSLWTQLPSLEVEPPLNPITNAPLLGFSNDHQSSENFHKDHLSGYILDSANHGEVPYDQAQPDVGLWTQLPPGPLGFWDFGPSAHLPTDEGPSGFGGSSGNRYMFPNCGKVNEDEHSNFQASSFHNYPLWQDQGDLFSIVASMTSVSRQNSAAAPIEKDKEADQKNEKDVSHKAE